MERNNKVANRDIGKTVKVEKRSTQLEATVPWKCGSGKVDTSTKHKTVLAGWRDGEVIASLG